MNLIPLYTVVISLFLGQSFQISQLVGGILVLGGICCITLPQKKSVPLPTIEATGKNITLASVKNLIQTDTTL
jgi:hypothetical protein